eukprot:CAMPEP_0206180304 /NCGR_PEP_ID=MMETSP1474-20131121/67882_1 /ASSEMBLY_ACC=CAM_ASM_001110 /TAXON_ID=97495 /ORGANISM="Imantonia sp., Strain RCC918" /LENGTH=45 /DNA_ID= /DNA_START= /DNA_END= /DNA_ORIENTATION=
MVQDEQSLLNFSSIEIMLDDNEQQNLDLYHKEDTKAVLKNHDETI